MKKKKEKGYIFVIMVLKYEGDFKNDVREVKGIFYYQDGDIYEGDWINDKVIYYYKNCDREMRDYSNGNKKRKACYSFC